MSVDAINLMLREALWPLWSLAGLFVLGLCAGSFGQLVAQRWPAMMERQWWSDTAAQLSDSASHERSLGPDTHDAQHTRADVARILAARLEALPVLDLSRPRSHCPHCGHRLSWMENLPVVSWLWLRGRCSSCAAPIGLRHPVFELLTGLCFLGMGLRWGPEPVALLWGAWACALLVLAQIDWDTTLLPDGLTVPLTWAGLLAAAAGWTLQPVQAIAGAALGYGGLWMVATVFERLTGREGMGQGDFKLLAAIGAWLGPLMLLPVVLAASLAGLAAGLLMKSRGTLREGAYVPFGPFLVAGALAVALTGPQRLLAWWGVT